MSVFIRLIKRRKKVFYCFYKITFPRKNAKLFVMALIKREILTSSVLKKMLFKIWIFHVLTVSLSEKKIDTPSL